MILPPGSTFADVKNAVAQGGEVQLPKGTIIPDSTLWITKPTYLHGDPDGSSRFLVNTVITDPTYGNGTSHQIAIGDWNNRPTGIRLSNFTIEHDRVAQPDMRTLAIDLAFQASNVEIDHITFKNITSNCVECRPWLALPASINNLLVHDCIATEWWEAFFDFNRGFLYNAIIYNNVGTVSNQHFGFQGPMGLEINIEQEYGEAHNVIMVGNKFTLTNQHLQGTSGFVINSNAVRVDPDKPGRSTWYDGVFVSDNVFDGFLQGVYLAYTHITVGTPIPPDKSTIEITRNTIRNNAIGIQVWPDSQEPNWRTATANDTIIFTNNPGTGNGTNEIIDLSRLPQGNLPTLAFDNNWNTQGATTMATVVLTVTPKADNTGTLPQVVNFRIGLGATIQTVPVNAGNPVSATFTNVAPGDYSAFAQNLDASANVVGSAVTLAVHVPAPATVFLADTLSAVVS